MPLDIHGKDDYHQNTLDNAAEEIIKYTGEEFDHMIGGDDLMAMEECYEEVFKKFQHEGYIGNRYDYLFWSIRKENIISVTMGARFVRDKNVEINNQNIPLYKWAAVRSFQCEYALKRRKITDIVELVR